MQIGKIYDKMVYMDIKKEQNLPTIGINSDFYLASPSKYAKAYFYYMLSVGHFYCKSTYCTSRKVGEYDSFLLIYLLNGKLNIKTTNFEGQAKAGECVLIDCYQPHLYSALEPTEFYYLHFDGNNSDIMVKELLNLYGNIFSTSYNLPHTQLIGDIVKKMSYQTKITESEISVAIHKVLCELVSPKTNDYISKYPQVVTDLLQEINSNYFKKLNIADISKNLNVSEQHLSRQFKCYIGLSPYKYLLKLRLNMATLLLKSTEKTISEISNEIGFSSESNFTNYFKTLYNTTPSDYRKK